MPNDLRVGIHAILYCVLLVFIAYYFIDKPVVFWMVDHHIRQYIFLDWFTHIPEIFAGSLIIIYPILIIRYCYNKFTYHDRVLLTAANSIAIANIIHDPLKIIFGRYWPATWVNNNLSLVRDHAYGFNWFHTDKAFASFPSGHTTITVAAMIVLWFAYPRLRWLAVVISLAVAIGLIGMYYHFVSDVIAGAYLGGLTGFYTLKLSKLAKVGAAAGERTPRPGKLEQEPYQNAIDNRNRPK